MRHTGHDTRERGEMDVEFWWESLKESLGRPRQTNWIQRERKLVDWYHLLKTEANGGILQIRQRICGIRKMHRILWLVEQAVLSQNRSAQFYYVPDKLLCVLTQEASPHDWPPSDCHASCEWAMRKRHARGWRGCSTGKLSLVNFA